MRPVVMPTPNSSDRDYDKEVVECTGVLLPFLTCECGRRVLSLCFVLGLTVKFNRLSSSHRSQSVDQDA